MRRIEVNSDGYEYGLFYISIYLLVT